ncbi:MAG: serine protease [Bacteroidaceae bacterium]|jgi:hypothetical protein|nr:serine protease [Bacteroidaceae bacterium]
MTDFFYEWYNALPSTLQVYWVIALITSLIFLIQMVMTFIGIGDADTDMDFGDGVDFSDGNTLDVGGAMQLFTIRNVVNFLLGLGWGGVCLYSLIPNPIVLAIVSVLVGALFVYIFLLIYKQMLKLEKNGAYRIDDCVGQIVDVYLTIPAKRSGVGKVQISFSGSVQELAALTDSDEPIRSGSKVRVLEIIDTSTVLVQKL